MRLLIKAAFSVLAVALLLFSVLYIFRSHFLAPLLKNYLISTLESEYGLQVDIGGLGGNYLTTLKILELQVRGTDPEGPLVSLDLEQADLAFFLPDLLQGEEAFFRNMDTEIYKGSLKLDFTGLTDDTGREAEPGSALPVLPGLSLHDFAISVQNETGKIDLRQLSGEFHLPDKEKSGHLNLRVRSFLVSHPALRHERHSLTTSLVFTEDVLEVQKFTINEESVVKYARLRRGKGSTSPLAFKAGLQMFSGELRFSGSYSEPGLELNFGTQDIHLNRLSNLLAPGVQEFSGLLNGGGSLQLDTARLLKNLNGELNFSVRDGEFRNTKLDSLAVRAEADSGTLRIHELKGEAGANVFNLQAHNLALSSLVKGEWRHLLADAGGEYVLSSQDIPVLFQIAGLELPTGDIPGHQFLVQGNFREKTLTATAELKTGAAKIMVDRAALALPPENQPLAQSGISAALQARIQEVSAISTILGFPEVEGEFISFDLDLLGTVAAPQGVLSLTGSKLGYKNQPLGDLTVRAEADTSQAKFSSLTLRHKENSLKAGGILDLPSLQLRRSRFDFHLTEMADYASLVPGIDLQGRARGTIKASGSLDQPDVYLRLDLDEAEINRIPVAGAHLEMESSGRLSSPMVSLQGRFQRLDSPFTPYPFSGEYSLDYSRGSLNIQEFELSSENSMFISLNGELPIDPRAEEIFRPGELALSGLADLPDLALLKPFLPDGLTLEGAASADISLTGSWQAPRGQLELKGKNIKYSHPDFPQAPTPLEISGDFSLAGRQLNIDQLLVRSEGADFQLSGKWVDGPALNQVLRGIAPRLDGKLAMRGRLGLTELDWLTADLKDLRRIDGRLDAHFRLEGPVNNPDIQGQLKLIEGELRTTSGLPSIKSLKVQADFEKKQILLRQFQGELGGAPFNLKGQIRKDKENKPVFDLNLTGSNILFFRNEWMKVRADTDLNLKGPLSRPELTGRVLITDANYRKKLGFLDILRGEDKPAVKRDLRLFSFRKPPLNTLAFQVEITSKNPVKVDNNIVETALRPDLKLNGTGELPVLMGRIYLDSGKITLPANTLTINSGLIQFAENAPNNPLLDIMADTRTRGYDLEVLIEGTYLEPVVTLSSIPPLPRDDLLLLLLTGRQPSSGGEDDLGRAAGTSLAIYFGREMLGTVFSGDIEDSVLERLQLEIGRSITRKGEETLDAQFRLGRDLMIPDDILYITAGKDIYDDYHVGLKIVFRFK